MWRDDKSTFRIQSMAGHKCGDEALNIGAAVCVMCLKQASR